MNYPTGPFLGMGFQPHMPFPFMPEALLGALGTTTTQIDTGNQREKTENVTAGSRELLCRDEVDSNSGSKQSSTRNACRNSRRTRARHPREEDGFIDSTSEPQPPPSPPDSPIISSSSDTRTADSGIATVTIVTKRKRRVGGRLVRPACSPHIVPCIVAVDTSSSEVCNFDQ